MNFYYSRTEYQIFMTHGGVTRVSHLAFRMTKDLYLRAKSRRMPSVDDDRAHWLARHVLPHEPALRAWLRQKASLGFDLDDVVQETYAILVAKASIDTIRNPKTYAFQTAYSVILQQLRRAHIVPINAVADIEALEAAVDEPSPEDTVLARNELAMINRVIAGLPRQTRQAFVMRRVEGLSQGEIARRMKLSEHTVEKHIARGIKLLLAAVAGGGSSPDRSSNRQGSTKTTKTRPQETTSRTETPRDDQTFSRIP